MPNQHFKNAFATHHDQLVIGCGVLMLLVLDAAITIPNDILTEVAPALLFQSLCWTVGFLIIVHTSAKQRLRLCEPGPLIFGLLLLYCIYPSLTWCRVQRLPLNVVLSTSDANVLFMLHGLFFLGIAIGYRLLRRERPGFMEHVSSRLPSPLPLLIAAMSVIAITTVSRVLSGGQIIPSVNYDTNWTSAFDQVNHLRSEGGATYIYAQILSKISTYPAAAFGIGCGLLLGKTLRAGRKPLRTIGIIGLLALANYVFGEGERSPVIVALIITILFADAIAGPISLRSIGPALAILLLGFMFAGYFRMYREYGVAEAVSLAATDLWENNEEYTAGEFTAMLAKEAVMLDRSRNQEAEGLEYIYENVVELVPSQIAPAKLTWKPTAILLSEELLGRLYQAKGAGVAGATIGDGLRLAGVLGVPVLGLLFGGVFGLIQRWSFRSAGVSPQPVLLRLALAAALYGFAFVVIRGSFGELLVYVLYGVVIPWFLLSSVMRGRSAWLYGTSGAEIIPAVTKYLGASHWRLSRLRKGF